MNEVEEIIVQVMKSQSRVEIVINTKTNRVVVNGEVCEILPSMIERLYSIIRTWKDSYSGSILENPEVFKITIREKEKTYSIEGAGAYPENYSELKDWLGDMGVRNVL